MIQIGKVENRLVIVSFTVLIIFLIGYVDYVTGAEMGFSFFYLIPISFLSLYKGIKVHSILFCSLFASILWFVAEYLTREYSSIFFPIWNAIIRLFIFIVIGLLFYYLKKKEKQLKSINKNLMKINDEKNKFIGIAAHDLRSPLSGIYSFTEILIEDYKENFNPDVVEILSLIKETSRTSLAILEDLLDISKIESGKVVLKQKKQDYIQFLKNHISINQLIANNKEIVIEFQSQRDYLEVNFDEKYLGEVVNNLISNAIKFSNRKTRIEVNVIIQPNNQVITEIIDQGIGIPMEEQQQLFNYFQTTSSLPTEGEKSTGLGLAIAKQIILLHKGTIGVKSTRNKGSNFYFSLPIDP